MSVLKADRPPHSGDSISENHLLITKLLRISIAESTDFCMQEMATPYSCFGSLQQE